ncbi:uncharacterized protein LOC118562084 isoform X2 [Fundulus heteroclitus]|uniref:uncharacterized protein LOC118562084 isoform X2 n=1 Tax=Fundulus heteroclitus TaxID=8078 RepID=UPI00165B7592|nr:uncharacterized protein LOC118562084 isoform X2 [Fundulus heteroclitus]
MQPVWWMSKKEQKRTRLRKNCIWLPSPRINTSAEEEEAKEGEAEEEETEKDPGQNRGTRGKRMSVIAVGKEAIGGGTVGFVRVALRGVRKQIDAVSRRGASRRACGVNRLTVKEALPVAADRALHSFRPGDWVLIRDFRRKHWRSKRWLGPFQVLLTTHTAVKVEQRVPWIHASHCRKVPPPRETDRSQDKKDHTLASSSST